jgi:hypothetical protein
VVYAEYGSFKASDANQDAVLTVNEFPIVPTKEAKIKVIKDFVMVFGGLYTCWFPSHLLPTLSLLRGGKMCST